jgi:hypothetical protein
MTSSSNLASHANPLTIASPRRHAGHRLPRGWSHAELDRPLPKKRDAQLGELVDAAGGFVGSGLPVARASAVLKSC